MDIDTTHPVLVTGATGYVAGWIIKGLLDGGATVHATVRDPGATSRLQHLVDMADGSPGTLRFFRADLLEAGSYAEPMAGCRVVLHTASPFKTDVKDPQKELVDPAVLGTRTVLETADATPSVTRVVLTSSVVAIYGDVADIVEAPGGRLTEQVWNTTSSLDHQPYSYSKTLAEREAWRIADAQDRWRLVAINPSLVIGPSSGPQPSSDSFAIVKQLGDGTMRMGAPRLGMGVVDVRDVAQAHLAAAFLPDASGRNIVSGHETTILELGQALRERFGDRLPLPNRAIPKSLLWLVAPAVGQTRQFVARNVGYPWRADTSKSRRELGMTYRPMKATIEEMVEQMLEAGAFAKA